MIALSTIPNKSRYALRKHVESTLAGLRNDRQSWWTHWRELAEMFLPRRHRQFVTANQGNRGLGLNNAIVDEAGILAARTLGTGLLANLTSPTKPWFKLGLAGWDVLEEGPVADWLAECTKRMLEVYAASNLYTTLGTTYHELGVFGSAAMLQYEDPDTVVRFYGPCLGEFFFGLNSRLEVDTLYREYTYTIRQLVKEFGIDNVSESARQQFKSGGQGQTMEVVVCHAIEPNDAVWCQEEQLDPPLASRFKYREVFWEANSPSDDNLGTGLLRVGGFREKPFSGLRWDVSGNDAYGRSPGMDALAAVRQLQIEQRRKAEAIDKMVRPPMVGSLSMRNEPANILPGGITWTADPKADGFKPAFTVEPRIAELMEDLREVASRIKEIFFNDLFRRMMDEPKVQTATWVERAESEKLLLLGPVVERTESEGLDEIINRTFNIMNRRNLFPPPPPEIEGEEVVVTYISILATAQRAAATASIERLFGVAGNLVAVAPGAMDNVDIDAAIVEYADMLNVSPKLIRAAKEVAAIRANRQAQESQAAALTTGATLAAGAKTLSETEVGGGQNALELMLQ